MELFAEKFAIRECLSLILPQPWRQDGVFGFLNEEDSEPTGRLNLTPRSEFV